MPGKKTLYERHIVRVRVANREQAEAVCRAIEARFTFPGGYGVLHPEIEIERLVSEDDLFYRFETDAISRTEDGDF